MSEEYSIKEMEEIKRCDLENRFIMNSFCPIGALWAKCTYYNGLGKCQKRNNVCLIHKDCIPISEVKELIEELAWEIGTMGKGKGWRKTEKKWQLKILQKLIKEAEGG